jgi:rhomboid-related protein 1/2/3
MVKILDDPEGENIELEKNDSLGSTVEVIGETNPSWRSKIADGYKQFVLNSNIPQHTTVRETNGNIIQVNRSKVMEDFRRKRMEKEEDETDGTSAPAWLQPSRRKEYESTISTQNIDELITCWPKCSRSSGMCLYSYTGFPLFITITSIIQICVFAYYYTGDRCNECNVASFNQEIMKSSLILPPVKQLLSYGEIWRVWTYQFLHANLEHIMINVFLQLCIGTTLEIVHGPVRVGALYTTGVIIGGCFHLMVSPEQTLVGASGGDYTLLGVMLANVAMNYKEMSFLGKCIRIVVLVLFFIAEVGVAIGRMIDIGDGNVSWACHLGGALVGLTFGIVILKNFVLTKKEIYAQLSFLVLFTLLLMATSITLLAKYSIYL